MKLTPAQQQAVEHRGSNLLVTASAGSGKTEVLARRCIALISDPQRPCSVDRLLVATFTRAAAAELRVRVARMLREAAESEGDAEQRDYLRKQAVLVDLADIGTIDSWRQRLVREHFAEVGVDPAFTLLSEQDAVILREDTLDDLFRDLYARESTLSDDVKAWLRRGDRPADEWLRDAVRTLHRFYEHLVDPQGWRRRQLASAAQEAPALRDSGRRLLAERLRAECAFQVEQLGGLWGVMSDSVRDALAEYGEALASWETLLEDWRRLEDAAREIDAFSLRKPRGLDDDASATWKEVVDGWMKGRLKKNWAWSVIEPLLTDAPQVAILRRTLLELTAAYHERLAAQKRQRAAYEFGDVERMALDLLGTPPDDGGLQPTPIALAVRRRYEHVLIDEYQDTSPIQVATMRLITRAAPDAGNRFMVGDVKQSIYGFREAEPRLFAEQADAFATQREPGSVIYLSDNFRSHAGVLDALNGLFAALFDARLGGTAFGEQERLRAGRAAGEIANPTLDATPRVAVRVLEGAERGTTDDGDDELVERIEREALLAADEIDQLFANKTQVPERSADGTVVLRPLARRDAVVLLRAARENAARVAGVLRSRGIPAVAGGRESLLACLEARDICNVLRLIANRSQSTALAAYLRGPLAGLNEQQLLNIRTTASDGDFAQAALAYEQNGTDRATRELLSRAFGQLDEWAVASRVLELPALLRRIIRDSGHELFAVGLRGGAQRAAMLQTLVDYARDWVKAGRLGVGEFVDHLEKTIEQDADISAATAVSDDVVRVMTVHASKGLEFPVVFLLGAGAKFNQITLKAPVQCDERIGLGLRFVDLPLRRELRDPEHHCLRYDAYRRDVEEELRLLYVALTRAREKLYVVGHTTPNAWGEARTLYRAGAPLASRLGARSMMDWTLMAAASGDALLDVTTAPASDYRTPDENEKPTATTAHEWTADDEQWVATARRWLASDAASPAADFPAVLSVSTLKSLAMAQDAGDSAFVLEPTETHLSAPTFARKKTDAVDGRALGTACHRFLQHADLRRLSSKAEIERQVAQLVANGALDSEEAGLLPVEDLAWLGTSDVGRFLATHADRCQRETPIVFAAPTGVGAERAIVRGVIDCLADTDDGLTLFDYKTDRCVDDAEMRRRVAGYTVQMQAYAAAAGAVLQRPVKRAALVFVRMRLVVEASPSDATASRLLAAFGDGAEA